MKSRFNYKIQGTDRNGNTWLTTGGVTGDFRDCMVEAMRHSFQQLTEGRATYGNPGVGCRGPYKVTHYELTLDATQ